MPRHLQSKIHSDFSTASGVWSTYKSEVIALWTNNPLIKADFNDHLIREYNKKINNLGLAEDLFITPYDAGFRFLGSSISGGAGPDAGFVFVFASGQQVFTNDGNAIQVPELYANA